MSSGCAIVVVNFNGWDDTRLCLKSLAPLDTSVILVDNASTEDRCVEFQREFPNCTIVRNAVNGGWAGGNNTGIRLALEHGAEWVLLLNNDTIVSPRLIDSLLTVAEPSSEPAAPARECSTTLAGTAGSQASRSFDILGPVICWMDEPAKVMTDGCVFNHPQGEGFFQRKEVALADGNLTEVDIVNGCAMMISARVFRAIGLIDERFFLIHEESDFCLRARQAGFKCGILGEALVWHKGSSSFARSGKKLQRYYDARNLYLLLNKHRKLPEGRGRVASLRAYFRYVYHRYCIEREQGNVHAANAVIDGLSDALSNRFGPMHNRPRSSSRLLRNAAEMLRQIKRTFVS